MKDFVLFDTFLKDMLKDPICKEAYEELDLEFQVFNKVIQRQIESKLTYRQYVKKLGVKPNTLLKLGRGEFNPTVKTLKELAKALDFKLKINLVPLNKT